MKFEENHSEDVFQSSELINNMEQGLLPSKTDHCTTQSQDATESSLHEKSQSLESISTTLPISQTTEHYTYQFDADPRLGLLTISENFIVISFPKILNDTSLASIDYFQANQKTLQMSVNDHVCFDTRWIPIFTQQDWYKCCDMFFRGYQSYVKKMHLPFWDTSITDYSVYHQKQTVVTTESVTITCTENFLNTLIKVDVTPSYEEIADNPTSMHFQLYFDNELFLCTKTLFQNISPSIIQTVLSFLLSKLIHW